MVIHRLFDPLMAESAGRGAALDWKTSLQELTAALGLGRAGVPDRRRRPGPREDVHRLGGGGRRAVRRRGRPQQEGGRAAGRRGGLADAVRATRAGPVATAPGPPTPNGRQPAEAGTRREPTRTGRPADPSRFARARATRGRDGPAGPGQVGRPAGGSRRSRCATRVRSAGTCPAPRTSPAVLAGRTVVVDVAGGASTCGCRWTAATRSIGHLGMSGQLLLQPAETPDETHLRIRFAFDDDGPELRFVDQRTFGGLSVSEGGADLPAEIAHIARDPIDPAFSDDGFVAALRRKRTEVKRALLDQTLISGVGNIYADEALWRAKLHGARPDRRADRAGRAAAARPRPRRARRGDARGRHQLRRALRQRQRRERLLRPVAERVRPGGAALPPVRRADPARVVHEPLVVQLPALPAPTTRLGRAGWSG